MKQFLQCYFKKNLRHVWRLKLQKFYVKYPKLTFKPGCKTVDVQSGFSAIGRNALVRIDVRIYKYKHKEYWGIICVHKWMRIVVVQMSSCCKR